MIKIEKNLWEYLQGKGFFNKSENNKVLSGIYDRRMYQTRLYRWNVDGFSFPLKDVKSVFNQTKQENQELISYYMDCIVETNGHIDLDKTAINVVFKVNQRLSYISDSANSGRNEKWARPIDTHNAKKGDCEDYAILSCHVCGLLGVPQFRRFVRTGYVIDGSNRFGHATFIYLSTKTNEFYPLEGSFYPYRSFGKFDKVPLKKRNEYENTWFIFNEETTYGTNPLIQVIK